LREALAADSCNKKKALELAEILNRAGDHRGAIAVVEDFDDRCGRWHRLLWAEAYAREQLEDWQGAASIDTVLINHDPADSDFWWWRGRARLKLRDWPRAEADLRQSMTNRPNRFAASFFASDIGDHNACAAAFALQFFAERSARLTASLASKRTKYYVAGDCENLEGQGSHAIAFDPAAPVAAVSARVNGRRGSFILDPAAAYVTLSRDFADQAAISPGPALEGVLVLGDVLPAAAASAEEIAVGRARAPRVPVAITTALPGDVDGLIGQSFLWRFAAKRDGRRLRIRAR
jgi:hypothetical protein